MGCVALPPDFSPAPTLVSIRYVTRSHAIMIPYEYFRAGTGFTALTIAEGKTSVILPSIPRHFLSFDSSVAIMTGLRDGRPVGIVGGFPARETVLVSKASDRVY